MNDLVERGRTAYQKSSATQMRSGVFVVLLGGLFLFFGIVSSSGERSTWDYFLLGVGLLFILSWQSEASRTKPLLNQRS